LLGCTVYGPEPFDSYLEVVTELVRLLDTHAGQMSLF
jgi:hypothetical protein